MAKFEIGNKAYQMQIGDILIDGYEISNNDFKSEKELKKYISDNIKEFCELVLEDNYISHKLEYKLYKRSHKGNHRRIDILLECKSNKYIIELKNPKYKSENTAAIGQILNYGREMKDEHLMILMSTKYDYDTVRTITHYNLPIKFVYATKGKFFEFIKYVKKE